MKTIRIFILFCLVGILSHPVVHGQKLNVVKLEINYPVPAVPYYHVKADFELPYSSMIEVEMAVDGKTLRYTDLRPVHQLSDLSYPHLTNRPPSGAGLSQDHKLYQTPTVIGWVKWEPGKTYDIKLSVRMKKNINHDPKRCDTHRFAKDHRSGGNCF